MWAPQTVQWPGRLEVISSVEVDGVAMQPHARDMACEGSTLWTDESRVY